MRILIVCSGNKGFVSNFVKDQANALIRAGVEVDFYLIKGKGLLNYIKNLNPLAQKVSSYNPDVVHAHFGLSGLLCAIFFSSKLVTTYHGSDIHQKKNLRFSKWTIKFSKVNIFVTERLRSIGGVKNGVIIPCGVDLDVFKPYDKQEALSKLNLNPQKKYILFSSRFDFAIKNYDLARIVLEKLVDERYELIELLGYSRQEVALLMNACEFAFMTSLNEGSPQFIKEAMACNCPIVATNVGDIEQNTAGIDGCFITNFEIENVLENVKKALDFSKEFGRTKSRNRLINLGFDNDKIAQRLKQLYTEINNSRK